MPFYPRLRIHDGDSPEVRSYKRRVARRLLALRAALRSHIGSAPDAAAGGGNPDSATHLRIATWNIREFDSPKYGERLQESYFYIAEIIAQFDVLALQELREDLGALQRVMDILGPNWAYIATDVTIGSSGNGERMAFVYNTNRGWFRKIAGEITLPEKDEISYPHEERIKLKAGLSFTLPGAGGLTSPADIPLRKRSGKFYLKEELVLPLPAGASLDLPAGSELVLAKGLQVLPTANGGIELPAGSSAAFDKTAMLRLPRGSIVGKGLQFARTPFMVAFQAGWLRFNLCTVHIYFGDEADSSPEMRRRRDEIERLAMLLGKRAQDGGDSDSEGSMILLGDFNIVSPQHGTMQALTSAGFWVPANLQSLPSNAAKNKHYDQIAFFSDVAQQTAATGRRRHHQIEVRRSGVFDFFEHVFRSGTADAPTAEHPGGEDSASYLGLMQDIQTRRQASGDADDEEKQPWKYSDWRTYQMSDHLPMWVELRIDFGDNYLEEIAGT